MSAVVAEHWSALVACAETPLEVFFPMSERDSAYRDARRVCGGCPVRKACLQEALKTGDTQFGMRGGMTPAERRALARVMKEMKR